MIVLTTVKVADLSWKVKPKSQSIRDQVKKHKCSLSRSFEVSANNSPKQSKMVFSLFAIGFFKD